MVNFTNMAWIHVFVGLELYLLGLFVTLNWDTINLVFFIVGFGLYITAAFLCVFMWKGNISGNAILNITTIVLLTLAGSCIIVGVATLRYGQDEWVNAWQIYPKTFDILAALLAIIAAVVLSLQLYFARRNEEIVHPQPQPDSTLLVA